MSMPSLPKAAAWSFLSPPIETEHAADDDNLVIGTQGEEENLRVITAPNTLFGKALQAISGDPRAKIAMDIAYHLQDRFANGPINSQEGPLLMRHIKQLYKQPEAATDTDSDDAEGINNTWRDVDSNDGDDDSDEIPGETTPVVIEPEKELKDFLNEAKSVINAHLDAASTSLTKATQSTDASDPLTKTLTSLGKDIVDLKNFSGVTQKTKMYDLIVEVEKHLADASWRNSQPLLKDIKTSLLAAQKLIEVK